MPTFDFGTMKRTATKSGGSDYGFLVDQLDILENSLSADGKLSPGDYDLLSSKAREVYAHPGLTNNQRSNIDVKISRYKKSKSVDTINDNKNISTINNDLKSENAKQVMLLSNNPEAFLEAKAATLRANANQLAESIDQLDQAADDSSSQYNQYILITNQLQDTVQALEDVKAYKAGTPPKSDYAAYVTTNSKGQIVDLVVDRVGNQTGYNETNGVYGGLQIYGKLNMKDQQGNKIFKMGTQTFTASDVNMPNADGSMKPSVLIDTNMQKVTKTKAGQFSIASSGYSLVDPATVQPQQAASPGSFLEGSNGFFYQANDDGSYSKFVNTDKKKLMERFGVAEGDFQKIPRQYEQGLIKNVKSTDDGNLPIGLPLPVDNSTSMTEPQGSAGNTTPQNTNANAQQQAPEQKGIMARLFGLGRPNTGGAPTERAPGTASGVANQEAGKAKGFLARLFGQ